MKLIVFAAVVGVCAAGALDHAYLPPNGNSGNSGAYQGNSGNAAAYQANSGAYQGNYQAAHAPEQSSRPQAAYERNAAILKQDADVTADGFHYNFETENGIRAEESAHAENGVQAQGGFSYTGDDGQVYSINYSADEHGYQPQGAHLPTAPPTPEAILKALEQNARDEAAGIVDDGTYNAAKYGDAPAQQYGAPAQQYNAPAQQYNAPAQKQQSGSFNPKSGYSY